MQGLSFYSSCWRQRHWSSSTGAEQGLRAIYKGDPAVSARGIKKSQQLLVLDGLMGHPQR